MVVRAEYQALKERHYAAVSPTQNMVILVALQMLARLQDIYKVRGHDPVFPHIAMIAGKAGEFKLKLIGNRAGWTTRPRETPAEYSVVFWPDFALPIAVSPSAKSGDDSQNLWPRNLPGAKLMSDKTNAPPPGGTIASFPPYSFGATAEGDLVIGWQASNIPELGEIRMYLKIPPAELKPPLSNLENLRTTLETLAVKPPTLGAH